MMKRVVLYPYLFVLYLILNPLLQNLNQVDPDLALRPLVMILGLTTAGMLLLYLAFRDWQYAGYLVFLALLFLFAFGHLYRVLQEWRPTLQDPARLYLMAAWGLLLALLGLRRVWLRFGGEKVTPRLNVILALALASQLITSLPGLTKIAGQPFQQANTTVLPITGSTLKLDCSNRPDIYYIILDAHGRADVLNELYGVDTTPFLESLKRKGFYIAEQSHSNYTQTIFSISSSLNSTYIQPEPVGENPVDYFTSLIVDNQLMELLKGCGYKTVAFETGFSFTDNKKADIYMYDESILNEFESLLVADTPLDLLVDRLNFDPPGYSYPAHRGRVLLTFDQLKKIPGKYSPMFVFAHILSPHPPFIFTADGKYIQAGRSFSIADGDEFKGDWEEYRKGYAEQVQFVDKTLEQIVDAILAGSPTPPVIILQGDHGPGGNLNWDTPNLSCLWERTSILNAYYLPGGAKQRLYPGISPVNTFRVILDAYFNAGLELLPDLTNFTSHRLPRQVIDITGQRDSRDNCPMPAER